MPFIQPVPQDPNMSNVMLLFLEGIRQTVNGKLVATEYTTSQRDAITEWNNGDIIYNGTTNKFQGYASSAWTDLN